MTLRERFAIALKKFFENFEKFLSRNMSRSPLKIRKKSSYSNLGQVTQIALTQICSSC
jgi:hypothetical protein